MTKSEAQTRSELIDKQLAQSGWNVKDPLQVVQEFDITTSLPEGISSPRTPYEGHQFSDYVLLGKDARPLAVVEAKKTSKDAAIGREQAKQYCYNIQKQLGGELPFCFYTNGHDIYFWDLTNYPPRKVVGFPMLQATLYGYDIDQTMVRLGLMNLMMHGIDDPNIDYRDTLSKRYNEEAEYDIVMANPSFTGSIDKGDINESLTLSTTKTELLFVENIYRLLKKGGTACVIVPQGVLFGSERAFKTLRKMLVDRCDLKAVIAMPSGVFKPYAGVSTAILFFTKVWGPKDKVTKAATEHVWFYEMQSDGYSLDDKRTKQDGHGDLQDIVVKYHARNPGTDSDRTAKCFCVPRADIEAEGYDLSLSRYKEDVFEEVVYDAPGVILERLLLAELGEEVFNHEKHGRHEKILDRVGGIAGELLELRGMIG